MNGIQTPAPKINKNFGFTNLIADAVRDIRSSVEARMVVLGTSPNRFNDIYWFNWRGIRVDDDVIESDFNVNEIASVLNEDGKPRSVAAYKILEDLEEKRWRNEFLTAADLPWDDEVLALVVNPDGAFVVFSSSNNTNRHHVYRFDEQERTFTYVGECRDDFYDTLDLKIYEPDVADQHTP